MMAAIGMPKRAAVLLLLVTSAAGAPGDSSSDDSTNVYCDECGGSATYAETIDTSGTYAKRNVVTNGCPNHYNLCTGKDGTDGCGAVGEEGDGTQATEQDHDFDIPLYPILATSTTDWPGCVTYEIGVALNGVPIYGGAVSDDCGWSYGGDCSACILDVEDDDAEWTSFDFCGGHGRCLGSDCSGYHYHFPPTCLEDQIGSMSDGHSPQVGWSFDGFPVYGPFGPGGVAIANCGADGADATYCQDECGGYAGELSGVDDFTYRYYFSGPLSDLYSLPTDPRPATTDYPFAMACYKGLARRPVYSERLVWTEERRTQAARSRTWRPASPNAAAAATATRPPTRRRSRPACSTSTRPRQRRPRACSARPATTPPRPTTPAAPTTPPRPTTPAAPTTPADPTTTAAPAPTTPAAPTTLPARRVSTPPPSPPSAPRALPSSPRSSSRLQERRDYAPLF